MLLGIWDWLEDRTGLPSAVQHFLDEKIPASAGWHQVFGSVALFALLIQAATGFLLALNYGATPGEAHASIRYIMTELTGGSIIRGLHHWGASCMIVVVVLHMIQTFVWGAYKRPREATWIVGCALLLMVMAFGLTGYLLPWDNKAYWGTTVTTQIAGLMPGAGPYVQRLLGAEGDIIGNITFSRFYAAHVMLLPAVTMLLAALHLYLVRRHGVTPLPADANRPTKRFYPEQIFKDTVAAFAYVMIVALFANFAKLGLGSMADPTDTRYIPRPEWYFLFLFQLLKIFEGPLEILGAVVLPNLAILGLFLIPFIDRGRALQVRQRTVAITVVLLAGLGWAGLTQMAIATTPANMEDTDAGLRPPQPWREMPAEQLAAIGYFQNDNCASCHVLGRSILGPDLAREPSSKPPDFLLEHFAKPSENSPPTSLTPSQMQSLVKLVTKRDERGLNAWADPPANEVIGAMLYQARGCYLCHSINGTGAKNAPILNGLAARRTRDWVEGHFGDPKKFSPNSPMPAYKFSPEELHSISSYLMAIPK
ncbi:MAG: cytochrome b N-terminal domain-containing protein [Acidobacteriota bacterium]